MQLNVERFVLRIPYTLHSEVKDTAKKITGA